MNVKLKTKKLKSGRLSFYLSYYSPETQKRHKEYLGLYLLDKPKNEFDRNHNKETKALAQKVYSKKLLEFQEGRFGFKTKDKLQLTFLAYFESIMEIKKRTTSKTNYSNWYSTHSHLKKFTRTSLKLIHVDIKYLNDLKEYLLSNGISRGGRKLSPNSALSYFKNVLFTLREAFNEGLINENPGIRVKKIKPVETQRELLTEEEIQQLFETDCRDPRIKNSFLFGVLTGLRFSDIQSLKWKQLHHSNDNGWFIRIQQQKTKSAETLYINQQARDLIGKISDSEERIFLIFY